MQGKKFVYSFDVGVGPASNNIPTTYLKTGGQNGDWYLHSVFSSHYFQLTATPGEFYPCQGAIVIGFPDKSGQLQGGNAIGGTGLTNDPPILWVPGNSFIDFGDCGFFLGSSIADGGLYVNPFNYLSNQAGAGAANASVSGAKFTLVLELRPKS